MTLVCGGSPIIPLLVHQPAYLSIWPAASSLHRGLSQIQGRQCGAYVGAVEEMWVSCEWVLQREHSGEGCDLASTLCKYHLRKGDLFALGWARVRRRSLSSELLMCGGGVHSILLLPVVAGCLETI